MNTTKAAKKKAKQTILDQIPVKKNDWEEIPKIANPKEISKEKTKVEAGTINQLVSVRLTKEDKAIVKRMLRTLMMELGEGNDKDYVWNFSSTLRFMIRYCDQSLSNNAKEIAKEVIKEDIRGKKK